MTNSIFAPENRQRVPILEISSEPTSDFQGQKRLKLDVEHMGKGPVGTSVVLLFGICFFLHDKHGVVFAGKFDP